MNVESAEKISTQCTACSARMRVPAQAVGKRIRCPKCSEAFVVAATTVAQSETVAAPAVAAARKARPAAEAANGAKPRPAPTPAAAAAGAVRKKPRPVAPPTPPPEEAGSADDDLFAELARQSDEASATSTIRMPAMQLPTAAPPASRRASGRANSAGQASAVAAAISSAAWAGNRFLIGCALSLVGASIGGGIWYGVASGFGVEVGLLSILIGCLAGIGMALGAGDGSPLGGLVAVGATLSVYTTVRYLIIKTVIISALTGANLEIGNPNMFVTMMRSSEIVLERGLDPENLTPEDEKSCFSQAAAEVKRLSPSELAAKANEYREVIDEVGGPADMAELVEQSDVWTVFFTTLRRGALVGVLLALSAAFRFGSSGLPGTS